MKRKKRLTKAQAEEFRAMRKKLTQMAHDATELVIQISTACGCKGHGEKCAVCYTYFKLKKVEECLDKLCERTDKFLLEGPEPAGR